jgi:tetratricopeptide (TPR) repeat protein/transcriptional regulator with XRE-family HTH domain
MAFENLTFGKSVLNLRTERGWSQFNLARRSDVHERSIRNWESGKPIDRDKAEVLADVFGLTGSHHTEFLALADRQSGRLPEAAVPIPAATRALPRHSAHFTGRRAELGLLQDAVASSNESAGTPVICVIHGISGVGKTQLARKFAHQEADRYAGGQFAVNLYGHSAEHRPVEPKDVLSALLLAAGAQPGTIPETLEGRETAWRTWTAQHKVLLLLDDAPDADHVLPLLPGSGANLVLITTRNWLDELSDACDVPVGPMPDSDAAELFVKGADRPGMDPASMEVTGLLDLFYGMPIIITALSGQLKKQRFLRPSDLRERLKKAGGPLQVRFAGRTTVRDALALSYKNLDDELRRVFRYLALHPGPDFDAYAVAALCSQGGHVGRVLDDLDDIFGFHLLDEVGPGRYRLHGLIDEYARDLVGKDPAGDREAAERGLLGYYLDMARAADWLISGRLPTGVSSPPSAPEPALGDRDEAFDWMDQHASHLHAGALLAYRRGYLEYATLISAFMEEYLLRRGHWDQALDLHQLALDAAGTDDLPARARALHGMGTILFQRVDLEAAERCQREALALYERAEDKAGQARALRRLGSIDHARGDYPACTRTWQRTLDLFLELGDARGVAALQTRLGVVQHETGDMVAAFRMYGAARDAAAEFDDQVALGDALCYLGEIHAEWGQFEESFDELRRAIEVYGGLRDNWNVAGGRYFLGAALRKGGRPAEARVELDAALAWYQACADEYDEAGVRDQIGRLLIDLGELDEAAPQLAEALRLYDAHEGGAVRGEVLNSLGELALARARALAAVPFPAALPGALASVHLTDAFGHFQQAYDLAMARHVPREQARASEGLGHVLRLRREPEAAAWFRTAHDLYSRLGFPAASRLRDEGLA